MTKVLEDNDAQIRLHGPYIVMMMRLGALRLLEGEKFDDFDTICFLIEVLRTCIAAGVSAASLLISDKVRPHEAIGILLTDSSFAEIVR